MEIATETGEETPLVRSLRGTLSDRSEGSLINPIRSRVWKKGENMYIYIHIISYLIKGGMTISNLRSWSALARPIRISVGSEEPISTVDGSESGTSWGW